MAAAAPPPAVLVDEVGSPDDVVELEAQTAANTAANAGALAKSESAQSLADDATPMPAGVTGNGSDADDGGDEDPEVRSLNALASFLPVRVLTSTRLKWKPSIEPFDGVAVFADISGFTALTERLAREGADGPEKLVAFLNAYFGNIVSMVRNHGGDVVKFAGDALLAVWPGAAVRSADSLGDMTLRAVTCSLAIQASLDEQSLVNPDLPQLHLGIGAGRLALVQVGGMLNRCDYVVSGPPMAQIGLACPLAKGGDVVLSAEAWALVEERCDGTLLEDGLCRVTSVTRPIERSPLTVKHVRSMTDVSEADRPDPSELRRKALSSASAERYRKPSSPRSHARKASRMSVYGGKDTMISRTNVTRFIPGAAINNVQSNQSSVWMAELRRVSVIFISIGTVEFATEYSLTEPFLAQMNAVMRVLQESLYHYEGCINKLLIDDKGFIVVGALGLWPLRHEDDPVRACLAAIEIKEGLSRLEPPVSCSIGITTNEAFCGIVGNDQRREYTLMGDVVNTAARLMASTPDDIRCDEATKNAAEYAKLDHIPRGELKLKGKQGLTAVYQPVLLKPEEVVNKLKAKRGAASHAADDVALHGRTDEIRDIATKLTSMKTRMRSRTASRSTTNGEQPSPEAAAVAGAAGSRLSVSATSGALVSVFVGEAGIGKTRIVEVAIRMALEFGIIGLFGQGDSLEKTKPYYVWRDVFASLFGIRDIPDAAKRQHLVEQQLKRAPQTLKDMAPLLNPLLGTHLEETEASAAIKGAARLEKLSEVLHAVLELSPTPKLVVIDDAHHLDHYSWMFAETLLERNSRVFLVLAMRPMEKEPPSFGTIVSSPTTTVHLLGGLNKDALTALCFDRLHIKSLSPQIADLITTRSGGNPFYAQELAYTLRDTGAVVIRDGECTVTDGYDLTKSDLPATLAGVISARVDKLSPSCMLTLKVASAFGMELESQALCEVYPVENANRAAIYDDLRKLSLLEFIDVVDTMSAASVHEKIGTEDGNVKYVFRNEITVEVVYNLLLHKHRSELHGAIGEWLETNVMGNTSNYVGILAHHFSLSSDVDKAARYLYKASSHALSVRDYKDVIKWSERFFTLDDASGRFVNDEARGHFEHLVGTAYFHMGDTSASKEHLVRALGFFGQEADVGQRHHTLLSRCKRADRRRAGEVISGWGGSSEEAVATASFAPELEGDGLDDVDDDDDDASSVASDASDVGDGRPRSESKAERKKRRKEEKKKKKAEKKEKGGGCAVM